MLDPTFKPLNSLMLEEELSITGSGVNATLGMIFRPIDRIQVGISYASPTLYTLTDSYNATLSTRWNNFDYFGNGKPLGNETQKSDDVIAESIANTLEVAEKCDLEIERRTR